MIYIGIDPGVSGGIAMLRENGQAVRIAAMPATDSDIYGAIVDWDLFDKGVHATLERVWSSPGWGHVGAFRFGLNYGALRMALTAARIPFDEVLPKRWQQAIGVSYPTGKPRDKNISKRRAQALFPKLTVTHAIADALLLAEYGRRLATGQFGSAAKGR